jgi:leader peptidase (prepilin peptidase) / N-methyltransferase
MEGSPLVLTGLAAVLGAVIGSFLGLVLVRWPDGRPVVRGRSKCDCCGVSLRWHELVPLLSYAVQQGRCRRCGRRIDPRLPMIEAGAALIAFLSFLVLPPPAALITAMFGLWLLLLAALDAEHQWLPDLLTLPLMPAGLLVAWLELGPVLESRAWGLALGFASLFLIGWAYQRLRGRRGLGGGDPKLFGAIGAWLGWQGLPFVLLAASLIGLASVLLRKARGEEVGAADRVPLGALMAIAAWPLWLLAVARGIA